MPVIQIPTTDGFFEFEMKLGASHVLLGANGAGKTRLGAWIEQILGANYRIHRIGAHRSLVMNTNIQPPSYDAALKRLLYGHDRGSHGNRIGSRWQNKPATALLTDFDHVLAALYADENRVSVLHRRSHIVDPNATPPISKLDRLNAIWQSVLPGRELIVLDASLNARPTNGAGAAYDASELSDGERVIFYLIGQALLAEPESLIIVDEPELHINKSILPKLWDAIESERNDCALVYLTHDLEFTTSRRAASKLFLRSYLNNQTGESWEIEPIPDDTEILEEVVTKIIGSRHPILFVEGDGASLDSAIYRRTYDCFTVIAVGNADNVIHSVVSFRNHAQLHRMGCAGLVDADGRDATQAAQLANLSVHLLPVSEVENLLLLPGPFLALAKAMQFDEAESQQKLVDLTEFVINNARADARRFSVDYTRRRVDSETKVIGLASKTIDDLVTEFGTKTSEIHPGEIYSAILATFMTAVEAGEYETVLRLYDNKGLLSDAARLLGLKNRNELEEFVGRALRNESGIELLAELRAILPILDI